MAARTSSYISHEAVDNQSPRLPHHLPVSDKALPIRRVPGVKMGQQRLKFALLFVVIGVAIGLGDGQSFTEIARLFAIGAIIAICALLLLLPRRRR